MADIEPGTLIENRYYVEAEIGRGGMAAVYRVRHAQLGTLAAMKVLTLPAASIQQRLMQEGRVQAALQHPNIVAVSDVIVHNGAPGLVMEYVRGPSLDDFLMKRRLTVEQSDEIANGIIRGVGAAHKHGLIHRDLKPANIMLAITNEGLIPKITDFGLVKMILGESDGMSRTRSGVAMGTPSYMAPEQISDAKTVDARADIFSLGAILYELTSNVRAFEGTDMFKIFSAIVGGTYQPIREIVPEIPERMEAAIHGALEPDRDKRIANTEKLLAIWQGETDHDSLDKSRGPWDADLLAEVSTMGAGGESSAESLRRSFKGSMPLPTQSPAQSPGPFDPGKTGATVAPHPSDIADGSGESGASEGRTQSTMAPIPGMFDEPMPDSVQSPVPSTVPIPLAEPVSEPQAEPTRPPSAPSSRISFAVVGVLGLLVFGGATVAAAGGSWALGLFDREQPVPTPVPVAPDPVAPDPEPVAPDPEPVAPDPEPIAPVDPVPVSPDPRPITPSPQPIAPDPEPVAPEPAVPDPEPAAPDPVAPEPVAPDPEPVAATSAKPEVWIDSGGITVSLLGPDGRPANLRKLVAGEYRVVAFFTPNVPSEQGVMDIADGENWQVRCVPSARRCVIKQR